MSEIEMLKREVEDYEIVSFDVFDTLLLRSLGEPADLFKAVEVAFRNKFGKAISFYSERMKAEEIARSKTMREEVTYDEIYEELKSTMGPDSDELKLIEIELEGKFLTANCVMRTLYDHCLQQGKKVLVISDMYLPHEVIQRYLSENGFDGEHILFVSSELQKTKATGSLYKYIKELDIDSVNEKKWIHIGDNYRADFLNAKACGIEAYWYVRLSERARLGRTRTLEESIISALQINNKFTSGNDDYWYRFGVDIVSPIFIGLMKWLSDQIENTDRIFFLSRDGYLPYQLYQMMRDVDGRLPEARYIYASRRAYIFPQLLNEDQDKACEMLMAHNPRFGQTPTLRGILNNLGLTHTHYTSVLYELGINNIDVEVNEKTKSVVKQFLVRIWKDVEGVLQEELEMLKLYLNREGLTREGELAVFDIGWAGSTQVAIQKLLGKSIKGYYFGTSENIDDKVRENSLGFAFDKGVPLKNRNYILANVMMYELIFSAPEGSVVNFSINERDEIIPNIVNVERNDVLYTCIHKMQQGIIDIFREAMKYRDYLLEVDTTYSLRGFKRFIEARRALDLLQFSELTNSVGFGDSDSVRKYVTSVTKDDYFANRSSYIRDSVMNLWKGALLIRDDQGRFFNKAEIEKIERKFMFNVNIDVFRLYSLQTILMKAIRNPRKAVNRLMQVIRRYGISR